MIVSGDLGADRPLVPEEIGQRFEVSRTVVRESLRVLEAKGLVSARPNVGTRVRPVSDWNLLDPDIIEWRAFGPQRDDQRRELASCAGRSSRSPPGWPPATAARTSSSGSPTWSEIMGHALTQGDAITFSRADAEFHSLLIQLAGNRMLEHLSGIVSAALQVSGGPVTGCDRPTDASLAHHGRIVDALADGRRAAPRRRPCVNCSPCTRKWSASSPRRASTERRARARRTADAAVSRRARSGSGGHECGAL